MQTAKLHPSLNLLPEGCMSAGIANLSDVEFQLFEAPDVEALAQRACSADDTRDAFLTERDNAHPVASGHKNDEHEPQVDGEPVQVISAVREAVQADIEAGCLAARRDDDEGGGGIQPRPAGPLYNSAGRGALFTVAGRCRVPPRQTAGGVLMVPAGTQEGAALHAVAQPRRLHAHHARGWVG